MDKSTSIAEIRKLIAKDEIDDAIEQIIQLTDSTNKDDLHDEAVTISAEYERLEKEIRKFVIGGNEITLRRNRMMDQLLDLLNELEKGPSKSNNNSRRNTGPAHRQNHTSTGDGGKSSAGKWIMLAVGIIVLTIGGYFGFQAMNDKDEVAVETDCDKYIRDGHIAFDNKDYDKARREFVNAKHYCSNASEANKMITQCDELLAIAAKEAEKPASPATDSPPRTNNNSDTPSSTGTSSTGTSTGTSSTGNTGTSKPEFSGTSSRLRPEVVRDLTVSNTPILKVDPNIIKSLLASRKVAGFQQVLKSADLSGTGRGYARLDKRVLGNQPNKLPFTQAVYSKAGAYDTHPTAVYYNGAEWRMYHTDLANFTTGFAYNVLVADKGFSSALVHNTTNSNTSSNSTELKFNNKKQKLIVMPVTTGSSVSRNPNSIGVYYSGGKWRIFNQSKKKMPVGTRFHVLAGNQNNTFTVVATASNTKNHLLTINHSMTNSKNKKLLFVTQVWGNNRVYNNSEIGVWYSGNKWFIYNQNKKPIPVGAQFNVMVVDPS